MRPSLRLSTLWGFRARGADDVGDVRFALSERDDEVHAVRILFLEVLVGAFRAVLLGRRYLTLLDRFAARSRVLNVPDGRDGDVRQDDDVYDNVEDAEENKRPTVLVPCGYRCECGSPRRLVGSYG